jgi:serine protease Do
MGFAVPAPMIEPVVEQLIEEGRVQRGFLGVQIQDDPDLLRSFGYEGRGVLVSDVVPDGPAADAGIERGDIIVSLDGRNVETTAELRRRVASERPSQEIAVAIVRGREQRTIDVKLGTMPAEVAADGSPSEDGRLQPHDTQESLRKLGIEGAETLTSDLAGRYEVEDVRGVLVLSVRAQSVAASVGLRPGSVITEVGNESVQSLGDLTDALAEKDLQQGVRLTVREAGVNHFVFLKLPA